MNKSTRLAFERLLRIAQSDTGQGRRVANFLLAWWNADSLGGFDLADLFAVDTAVSKDMALVFDWLSGLSDAEYPESYSAEIEKVIQVWRPEVWARATEAR